jgi:hypothetical protein
MLERGHERFVNGSVDIHTDCGDESGIPSIFSEFRRPLW